MISLNWAEGIIGLAPVLSFISMYIWGATGINPIDQMKGSVKIKERGADER